MRIFKTKVFSKFAKKEQIRDTALLEAVERAEKGLIDSDDELETAKDIASGWLNSDPNQIKFSLIEGELKEVKREKKS